VIKKRGDFYQIILASLALSAAFAPIAQGQEVRRANSIYDTQLEADKAALKHLKAESERLKAEGERLKAEGERLKAEHDRIIRKWNELHSFPRSEQRLAVEDELLAQMGDGNRRTDDLNRKWDDHNRRLDQLDADWNRYSAPPASTPPPSKNDCLIVATET